MPQTYLVGYDGSDAARAAVRLTVRLAQAAGAEVVALTSHPSATQLLLPGTRDVYVEDARRHAEEVAAELDDKVVARRTVRVGSAAHALMDAAIEERAALIAVGAPEHNPLGRLTHSTTAERLLHGAPCPVLVVPSGDGTPAVGTIAVAYDLRPEAQAALAYARQLADDLQAELVLVAVAEPSQTMDSALLDADLRAAEEFRRRVEQIAAGIGATATVHRGDAGRRIAQACREGIDLLVCGSRAYGPLRSVLLGSVSHHLVDYAPCPVLVVPRPVAAELGNGGSRRADHEEAGAR